MTRPKQDCHILESLRPAFIAAGLINPETGELLVDAHILAAGLTIGLREVASTDPWGEPFALMIGSRWRGVDGAEPSDVQVRVTKNGVQLRKRTPARSTCMASGHHIDRCDNCWSTSVLHPTELWHPVTPRLKIRLVDSTATKSEVDGRRVEIQRRVGGGQLQPEAIWSEPWRVPHWYQEGSPLVHREEDYHYGLMSWVDVTEDIQVLFKRSNLLVRRATGIESAPWTSPMFVEQSYRWSDLVPDGSLQSRWLESATWDGLEPTSRLEIRQRIGRTPTFAVEPVWDELSGSGYKSATTNGYTLQTLRSTDSWYSVVGMRVTYPSGECRDILVTNLNIRVAPDLLARVSFQDGTLHWKHGAYEPTTGVSMWTPPVCYTLHDNGWTQFSEAARGRIVPGGVWVQIQRNGEWISDGIKPFGTAHELTDAVRVTFRLDQVAEVQCVIPTD